MAEQKEPEDEAVSEREARAMRLLDEICDALKERGVSLDELIESGREIRGEIVDERGIEQFKTQSTR